MKKQLVSLFFASLLLSGCSLFKHPQGGIKVVSNKPTTVYLDTKNIGSTPLQKQPLDAKKYALRLVPTDLSIPPYTSDIQISDQFETTVDWQFGATDADASGLIFETQNAHSKNSTELEIITNPDNVPITLNGENKGFSPLVLDSLSEGDYKLGFQAPGFVDLVTDVRLLKGKRVIVTAKLAKKAIDITAVDPALLTTPLPTPLSTPSPSSSLKSVLPQVKGISTSSAYRSSTAVRPYVQIQDTPTGFLRVRDMPNSSAAEIGRLKPGATARYMGSTQGNWFEIKYGTSSAAWVSSQFSTLVQ